MFQPQPTPFSPFSSYGINLSPPLSAPPPQPSLPLDFTHYNSIPLPLQQPQQQQPQQQQQQQQQSLPHSHPHSRPNSHPHFHANSISPPQSMSASSHSPPATIVDNNPSSPIAVGAQSGHSATAGRRLGSTLHQYQERHHPHSHQQPIFSPVNHNHHSHNQNNAANSNPNVTLPSNLPHNANTNSLPPPPPPPFAQHHAQQQYKMANNEVSDMEAQEALAREFQPTLEGPLVGEKKLSIVIAEEYAKADPIYVAKTAALPQQYSHYRPILGDGNCGWRAAGFSYFETLLRTSRSQVEEEIARMMSLNNLLATAGGFEAWLFEDMVEETTNLLKDMADAMETSIHAAEALILQRFNMADISNAIVYHFRLLASSWLQANAQDYEGFIPDGGGVSTYRKEWLEPPNNEIDHLGMTLLIDVLLKPIGFVVEIVYLDRSEGTQANSHIYQGMDVKGGPMIHLLYRPSHYDILYKDPISLRQAIEGHSNIQVNRATNFSHQHQIQQSAPMNSFQSIEDLNILSSIPGFTLGATSHHGFASQFQSPMSSAFSPSPLGNISPISTISTVSRISTIPSSCSVSAESTGPVHRARSSFTSINSPTSLASPVIPAPLSYQPTRTTLPMHSLPQSHPMLSPGGIQAQSFRPSKYEWAVAADLQDGPMPSFQTSTFKNSHYNTAHYNNPNFQPEEWSPEEEGLVAVKSAGGGGASNSDGGGSRGGAGAATAGSGVGYAGWGRKRSS